MIVSLAGVAASQRVTEANKGKFDNSMVKTCLTDRYTDQSETKVGHSDPIILYGKVIAQRIKSTLGITG